MMFTLLTMCCDVAAASPPRLSLQEQRGALERQLIEAKATVEDHRARLRTFTEANQKLQASAAEHAALIKQQRNSIVELEAQLADLRASTISPATLTENQTLKTQIASLNQTIERLAVEAAARAMHASRSNDPNAENDAQLDAAASMATPTATDEIAQLQAEISCLKAQLVHFQNEAQLQLSEKTAELLTVGTDARVIYAKAQAAEAEVVRIQALSSSSLPLGDAIKHAAVITQLTLTMQDLQQSQVESVETLTRCQVKHEENEAAQGLMLEAQHQANALLTITQRLEVAARWKQSAIELGLLQINAAKTLKELDDVRTELIAIGLYVKGAKTNPWVIAKREKKAELEKQGRR